MARFRIVRDAYCGYAVQRKTWWWPFWIEPRCNTHSSVERAEAWAMAFAGGVVKDLGRIPRPAAPDQPTSKS